MKRLLLCLFLLMLALPAHAETAIYTGCVREDMPLLTVTVTQEGGFDDAARHPYTLAAQIPHGETVYVLLSGIGPDGGWVLVWCRDEGGEALGGVGYVWHSFLGPWPLRVANTGWLHVREEPDKQSASIARLDQGQLVYPEGEAVDGWQPVSVRFADGGSFTGYIWHSFLEETDK